MLDNNDDRLLTMIDNQESRIKNQNKLLDTVNKIVLKKSRIENQDPIKTTAYAATPSSRPTYPIFSLVVALIEISSSKYLKKVETFTLVLIC